MTGARGGAVLYTPEILALAVSLAEFPLDGGLPIIGEARSRTCGSVVILGAEVDGGRLRRIGLRTSACAIGQASAALFASAAIDRSHTEIADTHAAILAWLAGDGGLPDWPGFHLLEPARGYPARHGAIPLAWTAALAALPLAQAGS